jgi:hypothetical protein
VERKLLRVYEADLASSHNEQPSPYHQLETFYKAKI